MSEYDPVSLERIRDNVVGMVNAVYFKKEVENEFEVVDLQQSRQCSCSRAACCQSFFVFCGFLWRLIN